jgi:hypothetical protein
LADFNGAGSALGSLKIIQEYDRMSTKSYGSIFEPNDLRSLGLAFDEAWDAVAARFADAGSDVVAQARGRLATIMMELAKEARLEAEDIKRAALDRFNETSQDPSLAPDISASLRAQSECH